MTQVLDAGYVNYIECWGSDQRIIEAARMSTDKGFLGWGPLQVCTKCKLQWINAEFTYHTVNREKCGPVVSQPGDEKLLAYLYKNKHMTPFEMAGMVLEVKAPIFVFREWHRHRTQSYNEMSARYVPLPDENYVPTIERIVTGAQLAGANRQAQGAAPLDKFAINDWLNALEKSYRMSQEAYALGIASGIPKELARLSVPVARYSRMRVTANLRNWLQFLELRDSQHAPNAQWEIRQYADAVGGFLKDQFPRTMALFQGGEIQ